MLKINQSPTFRWPITVMVPVDGGKHEPATFDVDFVRMPQAEVAAVLSEASEGKITEVQALMRIMRGWHDVVDESGVLPFCESSLETMLSRFPTVGAEILRAFADARSEMTRRKN